MANQLIGPVIYEGTLNGERYLNTVLEDTLEAWRDNLPLMTSLSLWYQHDGAPPHRARGVSNWLNTHFGVQWMGMWGPVAWPPRSPDLTPLDFYFWGYMKDAVYKTPIVDLQDLRHRINVTPAVLETVRQRIVMRAQSCVVAEGGHIEHNL